MNKIAIDTHDELLPEEKKLLQYILCINERSIAFAEGERGTFHRSYFSDYIIPTVKHKPWTAKTFKLAAGHHNELLELLQEKINAGVYEPAYTAYQSNWFYVKKKNDSKLHIVHDLQKLNSVTLRDAAVPPIIKEFVEAYARRSVYTVLDMYWGFHARILDVHSVRICDPTTQSRSRAEPNVSVRCPSICFPLFLVGFCLASGLITLSPLSLLSPPFTLYLVTLHSFPQSFSMYA